MTLPVLYAGTSPTLRAVDHGTRLSVREAIRRFHVRESAPTLERPTERTAVREASPGGATPAGTGRMLLRLIAAGWSLNGNCYPAEVLRRDGPGAWPAGTRCYADHASDAEEEAHPSGSVKSLAAVLTSDARWDGASQSLIAEARLFEPWRGPLTEMAEAGAIGMSIRAWVTGDQGERDGREGFVVDWVEGRSVDFVTVPAAGGEVISVLEAVQGKPAAEAASLGGWLESRLHLALTQYADDMYGNGQLTRDERIVLSNAIGDGLAAWTARVETGAPQLFTRDRWSEAPELEPGEIEPDGDEPDTAAAAEVTGPATDTAPEDVSPGPGPGVTPPSLEVESEEPAVSGTETGAPPEQAGSETAPATTTMTTPVAAATEAVAQPSTEVMTAAVIAAVEAATRPLSAQIALMATREAERDGAAQAERHRQHAARETEQALAAAEHTDVAASIRSRVVSRVTAAVPTVEGAVDGEALAALVTATIADEATHVRRERANALAEHGVGLPYGMGGTPAQEAVDDGLEADLEVLFKNIGMTTEASKVAAAGRGR